MKCIHCGREIPDGSLFCTYCGTELKGVVKTRSDSDEAVVITEKTTDRPVVLSKKKRSGSGRGFVALLLAVVLLLSMGSNIYQLKAMREMKDISADNEQLRGTVYDLQQENVQLVLQNEELDAEIVRLNSLLVSAELNVEEYREYCNQLQQQGEDTKLAVGTYNEMHSFMTNINGQRAQSFNENSNFCAGSNMICVKTGETVTLNVHCAYNDLFDCATPSNANIDVSIGASSGDDYPVMITGKSPGVAQLHFFYLGNGGHSFDVLVVVVP